MFCRYSYQCGVLPRSIDIPQFDKNDLTHSFIWVGSVGFWILRHMWISSEWFLYANSSKLVLLGEMGRYPLALHYFQRCRKYWLKGIQMHTARYPHIYMDSVCYQMIYRLHNNGRHTWATDIALSLKKLVFSMLCLGTSRSRKWRCIFEVLSLRLKNHFKSNWEDSIKKSSKLTIYSHFKCYLIPESYLDIINIRKYLIEFSKYRCSNHQLAIEQGRYSERQIEYVFCVILEIVLWLKMNIIFF